MDLNAFFVQPMRDELWVRDDAVLPPDTTAWWAV